MAGQEYDYVIVGAGSAGCTMAARLTEDADCRVLVLEAGGWDRDPWIHIPLGWGKLLQGRLHDWGYEGEPEPNVDGREVECARGKVIGGSSSINAMAYVRGHRCDFDRWAASGLDGWSYADVLPYFRRQETWEGGASQYRGGDGPLTVRESRYDDPLVDAYIEAGVAAGHPRTADYNGAQQEGFGRLQSTIRNGKRCSCAVAYLHPARKRPNLHIAVGAMVQRVVLENGRASAVQYRQGDGAEVTARVEREVILSAGTINTPQVLMLSGIGDPDELRAIGIDVRRALPGVGRNLQDHLTAMTAYARKDVGTFRRNMRADKIVLALAQAQLFGSGFATDLPSGVMGFLRTSGDAAPDTQVLFHAGPLAAAPYLAPFRPAFADGFSCRAVLLRPQSRGRLSLAGADPAQAPRIHWNFLATEGDKVAMRRALRAIREVGRQAPMRPFIDKELAPGAGRDSDADLDEHIRKTAITAHHPLGTCRMGDEADPGAVVDAELRVHGVRGLRVVDASVMPDMVGGNINAAIVMIAEKIADRLRGRPALEPIAA